MKSFPRALFLVILIVSTLNLASAQERYRYSTDAEHTFSAGLQLFRQGNFGEAAAVFDQVVGMTPAHQRTTAAYIMSAKSHFEAKNYGRSTARSVELLNAFPTTSYRGDAYCLLGLNAMMQQKYKEAAEKFLEARSVTADSSVAREALSYFELLATQRLDINMLTAIYSNATEHSVRDLLAVTLAERYQTAGDALRAKEMLAMVSQGGRSTFLRKRIEDVQRHLVSNVSLKIGVLLPSSSSISGSSAALANEVFDGIQFALEEFTARHTSGVNISLEVKNTNDDQASLSQVQELMASKDVLCVVGPLFSNHALLYAPIAEAQQIPMISPTANANGIAAKGKSAFQINPDVSTRGKAMARYAVKELGMTKLAVITSDNQQSRLLADEFAHEVKLLGVEVAAVESYSKDSSDLREQFMRIREAGATEDPSISFAGKFSRTQLRSMIRAGADPDVLSEARKKRQTVSVTKLFGPRGKKIVDSLHLPYTTSLGETYNIEIPVTGIQGIFAAISESEDIGIIASQMSYFNVSAQLLGSGEWYDAAQLEANKRYVDGVMFFSDSYADKLDSSYSAFERSFFGSKKQVPTRNTLYGYDTMELVLTLIARGATTRAQLTHALENVKNYRGMHATISLLHNRVNTQVHILQFKNNEIINVAEVNVN
jgi:ABC-type branched-subunit amino acid transport system substrate-binding protein